MFPMASFLAPVDTALICSRVKKVLEGHGLECHNVHSINYLYGITERKYFSGPGLNPSDSNVSYGILPCTC